MLTPIIDSHAHYNLDPIYSDWKTFMDESVSAGVIACVIPGVDADSTMRGAKLTAQASYFRYAVGIHPVSAGEDPMPVTSQRLNTLFDEATILAKPSAVGETGLDYYHAPADSTNRALFIQRQQDSFVEHIRLAQDLRLPLIVHVRDTGSSAYDDVLSILKKNIPDIPVILHCVSGSLSYVEASIALGCFVSFAGNVTYPNAQNIRDLIRLVPPDKLLIETDAPYLPPQTNRGKLCHPAYIRETAQYLQTLGVDLDQARANSQLLFGIE